MGFTDDINRFAKKAMTNSDQVVRLTVFKVAERLIEKTPVGDAKYWKSPPPKGYVGGHARANWTYSEGMRVIQEIEGVDADGAKTLQNIQASVPRDAAKRVHYIQNSVPYIERLEEGWSRQAPNGMVAITAAEFQGIVSEEASKL
jgi:hypothetical protein